MAQILSIVNPLVDCLDFCFNTVDALGARCCGGNGYTTVDDPTATTKTAKTTTRHKLAVRVRSFVAKAPILDCMSDLTQLAALIAMQAYYPALATGIVLIVAWRFMFVFAALSPKPEATTILAVYTPFALLPNYARIMGMADTPAGKETEEDAMLGGMRYGSPTLSDISVGEVRAT